MEGTVNGWARARFTHGCLSCMSHLSYFFRHLFSHSTMLCLASTFRSLALDPVENMSQYRTDNSRVYPASAATSYPSSCSAAYAQFDREINDLPTLIFYRASRRVSHNNAGVRNNDYSPWNFSLWIIGNITFLYDFERSEISVTKK